MKKFNNQKGLTLREVVITISMVVIISFAFILLYFGQRKVMDNNLNILKTHTEISTSLSKLSPIITSAGSILINTTINSTNFTTADDELVLSLPSLDQDGYVISGFFDTVVIFNDANNIKIIIDANDNSSRDDLEETLIDEISSLNFEYSVPLNITDSDNINVEISKNAEIEGGVQAVTLSKQYILQNK